MEMSDDDVLKLIDVSSSFSNASSCRMKLRLGEIILRFDRTCSNAASSRILAVNIK
jgi:hypothetical protein